MPITERTLTNWRKEALIGFLSNEKHDPVEIRNCIYELEQRILRLTQELIDAHLIRKIRK